MSNENTSIHDFDINLICEYFSHVERQGPGSPEVTLKALNFIDNLPEEPFIADLGCGTGGQTMVLAQHTPGKITGIDLFPLFIDHFNQNAETHGLANRVKGLVGTMKKLPFEKGSLDLIWSEGAIYNIGFERGLKEWREFLKPGGHIAVTEACWFTTERPAEIDDFWNDAYPEIDIISNKVAQIEKAGYLPLASFVLPKACWTEHFFAPQERVKKAFLAKHAGNQTAEAFVANMAREEELYEKYSDHYGYVFFIAKKTG